MKRKHARPPLLYCYYCGCAVRALQPDTSTCGCVVLMPVQYRHDANFSERRAAKLNRAVAQYQQRDPNSI